MKIVACNIRGLNKLFKPKDLCSFIRVNKISLLAIVEHRVTGKKCQSNNQEGCSRLELVY